jgi:KRAB domain-containing zinc finger protein
LDLNSKEDEARKFDLTLIIRTMFTECENQDISNMRLNDNKKSNTEDEKKPASGPKKLHRPAQCSICKKIFTRAWCLKMHMKTHDSTRKDECEFCFQEVVLEKHKLLLKTCDLCKLNTCNARDFELHFMVHQGKIKFECQICFSRFNSQKALRRHESGHLDDHMKPFSCIYLHCKKTFETEDNSRSHEQIHKRLHVCDICNRSSTTPAELKRHSIVHKEKRTKMNCEQCPSSFIRKETLERHMIKDHKDDNITNSFKCDKCGQLCTSDKLLETHTKNYHENVNLLCNASEKGCGRTFESESMLRTHFESAHPSTSFSHIFACNICDKTFKSRGGVAFHATSIHKKDKNFECSFCTLSFGRESILKSHLIRHTGEPRYSCNSCNQRFSVRTKLNEHMEKEHDQVKKKQIKGKTLYKCDKCEYKTPERTLLKAHSWKHDGQKPYKCPECDWSMTRSWGIRQHMKKRHNYNEEDLIKANMNCRYGLIERIKD